MIEVIERKRVPENCSTCLYGPNARGYNGQFVRFAGCGHADRKDDWPIYAFGIRHCPSYWLDQNRFERR